MRKILTAIICLSFILPAFAKNSLKHDEHPLSRVYIDASGGYGSVKGGIQDDGKMAQGRLALGVHAAEYKRMTFGIEAGIQSGNTMRLAAEPDIVVVSGGLPIEAVLKPLVDLLITAKAQLLRDYNLFGILKGGIAYRQLQLEDRISTRDTLRKVSPELQVGVGYNITKHAMVTAFYQGIYAGNNAEITVDSANDPTLGRIPTQQAGFLGFEYSF